MGEVTLSFGAIVDHIHSSVASYDIAPETIRLTVAVTFVAGGAFGWTAALVFGATTFAIRQVSRSKIPPASVTHDLPLTTVVVVGSEKDSTAVEGAKGTDDESVVAGQIKTLFRSVDLVAAADSQKTFASGVATTLGCTEFQSARDFDCPDADDITPLMGRLEDAASKNTGKTIVLFTTSELVKRILAEITESSERVWDNKCRILSLSLRTSPKELKWKAREVASSFDELATIRRELGPTDFTTFN